MTYERNKMDRGSPFVVCPVILEVTENLKSEDFFFFTLLNREGNEMGQFIYI